MATEYLTHQTSTLESTTPVSPSQASTAQIPLQSFTLPTFPPESFSATTNLQSLILTSDIKLDSYTTSLSSPFEIPPLPPSIKTLTLELFSLGYPAGWLNQLTARLPALKSLTLFSQLLAGTTKDSRSDAIKFLHAQKELRELHFLDIFLPRGFWDEVTGAGSGEAKVQEIIDDVLFPSLGFLEISYTFRHSDAEEFLGSLNAKEILGFVKGRQELVGLRVCISGPDRVVEDGDDREGTEEGVLVVENMGAEVVKVLQVMGGGLRMCDVTMFGLGIQGVEKVLGVCKEVVVLGVSVVMESGWEEVFEGLGGWEMKVEVLEVVGVPGVQIVEKMKEGKDVGLEKAVLEALSKEWKELKSVKVSVLRTKGEEWIREDGDWVKKE